MQCGILEWILEQKDISGKNGEVQIVLSLINSVVPMLMSWFRSLRHGYVMLISAEAR